MRSLTLASFRLLSLYHHRFLSSPLINLSCSRHRPRVPPFFTPFKNSTFFSFLHFHLPTQFRHATKHIFTHIRIPRSLIQSAGSHLLKTPYVPSRSLRLSFFFILLAFLFFFSFLSFLFCSVPHIIASQL